MKKKILSIVMMLVVIIGLVGCTPNMTSYMEKAKEVQAWKGSKVTATAEIKVSVKDENGKSQEFTMPMTMTGIGEGKEKAEVKMSMDMKSIKAMAPEETSEEELATIPDKFEMHMFVDGSNMYINKDYFNLLPTSNKEALGNIKEDYVMISMEDATKENSMVVAQKAMLDYVNSAEFNADIMSILEKAFDGYKPSTDFKVEGNKFTYEATSDQLIDETVNAVSAVVANWNKVSPDVAKLSNKLQLGIDNETIQNAVKEFKKDELVKSAEEAKTTLKGSDIKLSSEYLKDKVVEDVTMNLNMQDLFKMNIVVKSTSEKDDSAKVVVPNSAKKITMEEYMDLILQMPKGPFVSVRVNGENLFFEDQAPTIVEGRTLVPFRALLEKLGAKVEWNEKAQTVTSTKEGKTIVLTIGSDKAMVDGKEVKLDAPAAIENGRTIVPLRFLSENLGYKVKFDNTNDPFYMIDIFNTTEEELTKSIEKHEKDMQAEMEKAMQDNKSLKEEATSIGIIGGADGPTAMYTTSENKEEPKQEKATEESKKESIEVISEEESKAKDKGYVYSDNPIIKNAKTPETK